MPCELQCKLPCTWHSSRSLRRIGYPGTRKKGLQAKENLGDVAAMLPLTAGFFRSLFSAPSVGRCGASLDEKDIHEPRLLDYIKKNPPVTDPAAKGGFFIMEWSYVTSERIFAHHRPIERVRTARDPQAVSRHRRC